EQSRLAAKQRARDEKEARRKPKAAVAGAEPEDEEEEDVAPLPAPPRISGREEAARAGVQGAEGARASPVPVIKAPPQPEPKPAATNGAAHGKRPDPGAPAPTEALPPLSLLELPQQPEDLVTAADLTTQANLLVAKLGDFDIQGRVTEIHPGPVVTMF